MAYVKRFLPIALAIYCSVIFLSSIQFKFGNKPETQEIFGRLNAWSASWGADGLFAQTGLFSQYVIGSAEILASITLLLGILTRFTRLQGFGALLGLAIMTGAISFHLFTPLGIDPNDDGGGLFVAACFVWLSCVILIVLRREEIGYGLGKLAEGLFGKPVTQ
ncbi:MAG: DoxX family protein [Hyphomonadaceae bacterium]|nr:DoxX family protein [Hyphomonadaceae bacterium]MBC6411559.1 DoxX family protein [Hyphomonadaceae bacterium]